MLAKNGLLIVSNPTHIGKLLTSAEKYIKNTVYIQLLCALGDPFGAFHPQIFTSWPKYSQTIHSIYSQVFQMVFGSPMVIMAFYYRLLNVAII